jgi:HEPN domain-containing protein
MPPEHESVCREWLKKAISDLRAAKHVMSAEPPFVEDALFHSQQVVEKAVKGFLVWHGVSFRKTHDLREISGALLDIEPSLEPLLKKAALLTPFAAVFRYPGDAGEPTVDEGNDAIDLAEQVLDAILALLPFDAS